MARESNFWLLVKRITTQKQYIKICAALDRNYLTGIVVNRPFTVHQVKKTAQSTCKASHLSPVKTTKLTSFVTDYGNYTHITVLMHKKEENVLTRKGITK